MQMHQTKYYNLLFSQDMLPFWYRKMIRSSRGKHFIRAEGGDDIVFKHHELFVIGMFESGYHPVLNIRYIYIIDKYLQTMMMIMIN